MSRHQAAVTGFWQSRARSKSSRSDSRGSRISSRSSHRGCATGESFSVLLRWLLVAAGFLLAYLWRLDGARGVLLAALAVMVGIVVFWRWLTRGKPLKAETPAQKAEVRAIRELEDKGVQNKMASLVILKDGWLTTFVTRAVLFFFNILYRTVFTDLTPGRLAGLHTIHFGHWTLLDLDTTHRWPQAEGA